MCTILYGSTMPQNAEPEPFASDASREKERLPYHTSHVMQLYYQRKNRRFAAVLTTAHKFQDKTRRAARRKVGSDGGKRLRWCRRRRRHLRRDDSVEAHPHSTFGRRGGGGWCVQEYAVRRETSRYFWCVHVLKSVPLFVAKP